MTRHDRWPGVRQRRGFSLIELLVSLAIGLLVVVVASSAYLGAAKAGRLAEAQGRMNDDAQAALSILTQQLRMAGHNPVQPHRTSQSRRNPVYGATGSNFIVRGCDGAFSNVSTAARIDDLSCKVGPSDSIAVSYEADRFNTVAVDSLPTDCLGFKLNKVTGPDADYYVAGNLFYIATAATQGTPSLHCKGNGLNSKALPLVENVEDMQFIYGAVAEATTLAEVPAASVVGYRSANEIGNDAEPWGKVVSVGICLLVRSEAPVVADAGSAQYYNCASPSQRVSAPDLRLRRAYWTTVVLRNRRL